MKSTLSTLFSKPKVLLPVVAGAAFVIGIIAYQFVGHAPVVILPGSESGTVQLSDGQNGSTNLAFPLAGRVATVNVAAGDRVTKGEVLATLDGGTAKGSLNQAKGALELAETQYGSLDLQYQNAKKQQDVLVENAYRTLLSSGLQARAVGQDDGHVPTITGTYSCDKEGSYEIDPYQSGTNTGYSFTYSGLEAGGAPVNFNSSQPLGSCGLSIQFAQGFYGATKWIIDIPNTRASTYAANRNAYDLALTTRDQVLSQLAANLGQNGNGSANVAKAAVDSAEGAYQAALAAYNNTIITAPVNGTVSFVDTDLKVGQSVAQNKSVISITTQ